MNYLPGHVPVRHVDPQVRGALRVCVLRLAGRKGLQWRVRWVTKRTRHWRGSLAAEGGLRVFVRYRPERARWELRYLLGALRDRIIAHTGVDPTAAVRKGRQTTCSSHHRRRTQAMLDAFKTNGASPPQHARTVSYRLGTVRRKERLGKEGV